MMSRVTMLSRAVKGSSVVVLRDGVAISPWHDLPLVGEHGALCHVVRARVSPPPP